MSLKQTLHNYIKAQFPNWVSGRAIERYTMEANFKVSNGERRLRELAAENLLERRIIEGHVEYRYPQALLEGQSKLQSSLI